MSRAQIEINERTELEKNARVRYLQDIAKQSTEDLKLLHRLATLSKAQKALIKNHPMVKKYLK